MWYALKLTRDSKRLESAGYRAQDFESDLRPISDETSAYNDRKRMAGMRTTSPTRRANMEGILPHSRPEDSRPQGVNAGIMATHTFYPCAGTFS